MKIIEIIKHLEDIAPLSFQESYDNSGLLIGGADNEISAALLTLDVTEEVLDEAIRKKANLIIAHHPIIFKGIKKLIGSNEVERVILKAIKENIAIYAAHTNMDSVLVGVNSYICKELDLRNIQVLRPMGHALLKLVSFVPEAKLDEVRRAIFEAGAGSIGNYNNCSFSLNGTGSFRGGENTNPFVGEKGKLHQEKEVRLETIVPRHLKKPVVQALLEAHPYEEVAYDLYPLENDYEHAGMGVIGELSDQMDEKEFLGSLKNKLNLKMIQYSPFTGKMVNKVAICGGAGSFLLDDAIRAGANVFISGDFKYHEFFRAEKKILIADIGHYESEQHVKQIFYDLLIEKFPTFAFQISEINTNPVNLI
ncbi:MAG: Nif3-like dinuclear metal center hexameric protein [Bacteroidales bacterium]|nr:Nif3-like dinuclear metal center hexameric protein [Bacteroidales bacterium]